MVHNVRCYVKPKIKNKDSILNCQKLRTFPTIFIYEDEIRSFWVEIGIISQPQNYAIARDISRLTRLSPAATINTAVNPNMPERVPPSKAPVIMDRAITELIYPADVALSLLRTRSSSVEPTNRNDQDKATRNILGMMW